MAKRPNVRSVRSKQNQVLRYVVSTDVDKTSKDLDVSTDSLKRFLNAKPETVKKNPSRFSKLLQSEPTKVAKEKNVKQVQKLTGKRLSAAFNRYQTSERTARSIRYSQATRRRRRVEEGGTVRFVVLDTTKGETARKQILENMGGTTAKQVMTQYHRGDITQNEAKRILRKLWANSGVKPEKAEEYFDENNEE